MALRLVVYDEMYILGKYLYLSCVFLALSIKMSYIWSVQFINFKSCARHGFRDFVMFDLEDIASLLDIDFPLNLDDLDDATLDSIESTISTYLEELNNVGVDFDDTHRDILLSKIADILNVSQDVIDDNISIIQDSSSMGTLPMSDFGDVQVDDNHTWNGEFTSAGCWDECKVSVGDAGKRLTCGYNL